MSDKLTELTEVATVSSGASFYVVDPELPTEEKRRRISRDSLKSIFTAAKGSDKEIQYNNNGDLDSSDDLVWDHENNRMGIGRSNPEKVLDVIGDFRLIEVVTDTTGRPVTGLTQTQFLPASIPVSLVDYHVEEVIGIIQGDTTSLTTASVFTHEAQARSVATTDVRRLVAYYGTAQNFGSNTVDDAVCYQALVQNTSDGTINNARAIVVFDVHNSAGGTILKNYGIYIEELTEGTDENYGIYSLGNNKLNRIEVESLKWREYTFATLPSTVTTGTEALITDGSSVSYRAVASGGGSEVVKVLYNGTNWIYI